MENSRIITIRDILIGKFFPMIVEYQYPYWSIEGTCSLESDILREVLDTFPDAVIDSFSYEKIDEKAYKFFIKFSFEEEINNQNVFNFFRNEDDFEEG